MSTLLRMDSAIRISVQNNNNAIRSENVQGGMLTVSESAKPQIVKPSELSKEENAKNDTKDNFNKDKNTENMKRLMTNRFDKNDCRSCKTRRYMDGSNDPGVSFKSPTAISSQQSFSAVLSHENEHVTRENAKAQENSREVVSQNVRLFSAICPECGVTYTAGGETTTVTKAKSETNENQVDTRI